MQKEKREEKGLLRKQGTGKNEGGFISIEKKISYRFGRTIMICCIVLGVVASILSYISSVSAISETINNTSDVAADYVAAALEKYIAVAYETGSIARLADPERAVEEKAEILNQRINDHDFDGGFLLDSNGIDVITGTNLSDRDYFKEAMKGNTYVSTPAYSEVTKSVSYAISAPLWQDGIPGTTPVGAVVYVPNGEFLNDIMRSIKVGEGGTAFMLDANGITIADIDSTLVGVEDSIALGDTNPKLKDYSAICKRMVAGENGTGTYSYGGKTKVVAYSPLADMNGWSIGVAAVRSEFLGMFFLSLVVTVLFVIAFTLIGIRNGIKLGRNVVKPIKAVVERLELLAAGDLHSDTPVPETNDETATLMDCLAETIQDLKIVISEIDNHLAELSDGNFLIRVDDDFKGDFAQISASFRGIIEALSSAMRDIDGNAESVQKGATDLAGASQTLEEGATDQASAIE
ncbi:MAG: methyl-accepting chemotaxis protein [Lachnospiraceae bacterium]|nr:methyl-accepting chemotaxis protein [Lachnospiraceae bacterium]